MKGWYIASIVVTILSFGAGIVNLVENHKFIGTWMILIGTLSLVGIIHFLKENYTLAKTLFIISGLMGFPIGIVLIIFGYKIDN